ELRGLDVEVPHRPATVELAALHGVVEEPLDARRDGLRELGRHVVVVLADVVLHLRGDDEGVAVAELRALLARHAQRPSVALTAASRAVPVRASMRPLSRSVKPSCSSVARATGCAARSAVTVAAGLPV